MFFLSEVHHAISAPLDDVANSIMKNGICLQVTFINGFFCQKIFYGENVFVLYCSREVHCLFRVTIHLGKLENRELRIQELLVLGKIRGLLGFTNFLIFLGITLKT